MASITTLNVVDKLINVSLTDGTTTLNLEGLSAELSIDSTANAILKQTGDLHMEVDTDTGAVMGVVQRGHDSLTITTIVSVLSAQAVDGFADNADGTFTISFDAAIDLSGVTLGDIITVSGDSNAGNNGTFRITAFDDVADTVTIANADGVAVASGSAASADIDSPAANDIATTRSYFENVGLCYS